MRRKASLRRSKRQKVLQPVVLLPVLAILVPLVTFLFGARPRYGGRAVRRGEKLAVHELAEKAMLLTMPPPHADEVCFSPAEPCDVKLIKFIATAAKSLDVAIYDINLDQLVHGLAVKSKQIKVRIVVDRRQAKGVYSLVGLLERAGVAVRYGHQRGIMHNKFVVRDGSMIETGSFNYTNHASEANNENQVYLATPMVVKRYQRRFDQIWAEATPVAP